MITPQQRARETLEGYSIYPKKPVVVESTDIGDGMMDEQLGQWLKAFLEEQRKQTKALNDMGCMILGIAFVVVGGAVLVVVGTIFTGMAGVR